MQDLSITVAGPVGIGKTGLIYWIYDTLDSLGYNVQAPRFDEAIESVIERSPLVVEQLKKNHTKIVISEHGMPQRTAGPRR